MFDYKLTFKEKKKPELMVTMGRGEEIIIKISGKLAKHIFDRITDNPRIWEYLETSNITTKEKRYNLRADIAPIIISYILLNRRSPKPEKWDWFLNVILDGKLSIAGKGISNIVEMFLTVSNIIGYRKAADIVSSMLKTFAEKVRVSVSSK